jgi:hypothetical protein
MVELTKLPNIKDTVQKERVSLFIDKVRSCGGAVDSIAPFAYFLLLKLTLLALFWPCLAFVIIVILCPLHRTFCF